MRIRLVRRQDGKLQPMAEVKSGKGKKVTTGKPVAREDLRAEVARLIDEVHGPKL